MDLHTDLFGRHTELAAVQAQIADLTLHRDDLARQVRGLQTLRDKLCCQVAELECRLESLSQVVWSGGSGDEPDGRVITDTADEPITVAGIGAESAGG